MAKKIVKFLETVSPYQTGEIAGFEDDVADKLIETKKAVEYKKDKKSGQASQASQSGDDSQNGNAQGGNDSDPASEQTTSAT